MAVVNDRLHYAFIRASSGIHSTIMNSMQTDLPINSEHKLVLSIKQALVIRRLIAALPSAVLSVVY